MYDRQRGWLLHNVGNGPALNIMVAARKTHEQPESEWQAPTRVPPIARDAEFELKWLAHSNVAVLAATYQDFLAADTSREPRSYTVTCAYDLNHIVPRRILTLGVLIRASRTGNSPNWRRECGRLVWRHWRSCCGLNALCILHIRHTFWIGTFR